MTSLAFVARTSTFLVACGTFAWLAAASFGLDAQRDGASGTATVASFERSSVATSQADIEHDKSERDKLLRRIQQHSPLPAPPADTTNRYEQSAAAARLGQRLFYDARVSVDGRFACSTCHDPALGFADGKSLSDGVERAERHTPSLWNVAQRRWMFWDGRSDSLWGQSLHPIESAREMGGSRAALAQLLREDATLAREYEAAFDAPPPRDEAEIERALVNVGKALAAYETLLVADQSPFDRYVAALRAGDLESAAAYPAEARRGLELFVGRANCRSCHAGPDFSDGEFHNLGVPPLAGVTKADPGRMRGIELLRNDKYNAQSKWSDDPRGGRSKEIDALIPGAHLWGQFKTPSLRNVAQTAPYMHQGQLATLEDVVRFYSKLEGAIPAGHHGERVLKPLDLTPVEEAELVAFLRTLTDDSLPAELRGPPRD